MFSRNILISIALFFAALLGFVYYLWSNARPIYYINLPYGIDHSESIKKILNEIDSKDLKFISQNNPAQNNNNQIIAQNNNHPFIAQNNQPNNNNAAIAQNNNPFVAPVVNNNQLIGPVPNVPNVVQNNFPSLPYDNKICSVYTTKYTDADASVQSEVVKETIRKLSRNEGTSDTVYKYTQKGVTDRYASHIIPLIVSGLITSGDILELGIGKYSTPALNLIAKEQKKFMLSLESELSWMQNFVHLNDSVNHLVLPFNSECGRTLNENKRWGLVFVDHLQGEKRHLDIIKYAERAQIVVAHDSEKSGMGYYMYHKAYPYFKYHCKSTMKYPDGSYLSTSMLSNYVSFEAVENILKNVDTSLQHIVCNQDLKKRR